MSNIRKKAQILILTLFVMFVSLGTVLVLLIPVNYQLFRVRKIIYSFQAFSEAESNLEIGNLYVTKNSQVSGFNYSELHESLERCKEFGERVGVSSNEWFYGECKKILITSNENINTEIYYTKIFRPLTPIYNFYSKVISEGNYKGLKRVLDFDFLP